MYSSRYSKHYGARQVENTDANFLIINTTHGRFYTIIDARVCACEGKNVRACGEKTSNIFPRFEADPSHDSLRNENCVLSGILPGSAVLSVKTARGVLKNSRRIETGLVLVKNTAARIRPITMNSALSPALPTICHDRLFKRNLPLIIGEDFFIAYFRRPRFNHIQWLKH